MNALKGAAASAAGTADVCDLLRPPQFAAAQSASFVDAELGERIFGVLRCRTVRTGSAPNESICAPCSPAVLLPPHPQDEYCFTDRALLHLDGNSPLSKKRLVTRYPWKEHRLSHVQIETAGNVDWDAELKFELAGKGWSIDVAKAELPCLTALWRALCHVAEAQAANERALDMAGKAFGAAAQTRTLSATAAAGGPLAPGALFQDVAEGAFAWLASKTELYRPASYGAILERFVQY